MPSPKRLIAITAGFLVIAVLCLAYSYFIEPNRLVVTTETIVINDWNPAFDGLKIAMISDVHGGSNGASAEQIRRVVETTNAQNPDVIVLLGDYVSQAGKITQHGQLRMSVKDMADNLAGLKARYGVYAVLGNHDGWYNDNEVATELTRVGYRVLQNEIVFIEQNGVKLRLLGLKDHLKLDSWVTFDATVRQVVSNYPKEGQLVVL